MDIPEPTTEVKRLIEAIEQADSAESLSDAVEALADIRQEASIPTLIKVLLAFGRSALEILATNVADIFFCWAVA